VVRRHVSICQKTITIKQPYYEPDLGGSDEPDAKTSPDVDLATMKRYYARVFKTQATISESTSR
jgi:hypothetical protein